MMFLKIINFAELRLAKQQSACKNKSDQVVYYEFVNIVIASRCTEWRLYKHYQYYKKENSMKFWVLPVEIKINKIKRESDILRKNNHLSSDSKFNCIHS